MAKKQTESTVNPITLDDLLIVENAGPQSDTKDKGFVITTPAQEVSLLTTTAGVLKSRH